MVTMERPTPSADGAPPPTIAWAGADTSNAKPTIIWSMIFIPTGIARTARIAKGRSSGDRGWSPRRHRVSRFRGSAFTRQGMMLEAVIWDFGGVLTTSPFEAFARFEIK